MATCDRYDPEWEHGVVSQVGQRPLITSMHGSVVAFSYRVVWKNEHKEKVKVRLGDAVMFQHEVRNHNTGGTQARDKAWKVRVVGRAGDAAPSPPAEPRPAAQPAGPPQGITRTGTALQPPQPRQQQQQQQQPGAVGGEWQGAGAAPAYALASPVPPVHTAASTQSLEYTTMFVLRQAAFTLPSLTASANAHLGQIGTPQGTANEGWSHPALTVSDDSFDSAASSGDTTSSTAAQWRYNPYAEGGNPVQEPC